MPTFKLSTANATSGGSTASMRPSLLNTTNIRSGARPSALRAPASQNARVPIPRLQPDTTLQSAERFGDVLVNSVRRVREKKDKFLADEAALEFSDYARRKFFGADNPDGTREAGYSDLTGVDAVDAAYDYQAGIDKGLQKIAGRLSPAQRQKAMLRLSNIRSVALNRGASWHAQQQEVAEQQALTVEVEDVRKEISVDPLRAWVPQAGQPSMVEQTALKFPDPKMRMAVKDELGKFTVFKAFNTAQGGPKTPEAIAKYNAAKESFKMIAPQLPEKTKQYLRHWLGQRKDAATVEAHQEQVKAMRSQQIQLNSNASGTLIKMLATPGTRENAAAFVADLYKVNANTPTGGGKVVRESVENALYYTALNSKNGVLAAREAYSEMLDAGAQFDGETFLRLKAYVDIDLPQKIDQFRTQKDIERMRAFQPDIEKLRLNPDPAEAERLKQEYLKDGPLPKSAEAFTAAVDGVINDSIKAQEDERKQIRQSNAAIVQGWLANPEGPTEENVVLARDLVTQGKLDIKYLNAVIERRLGVDPVSKAIRASEGYKNAYKAIKDMRDKSMFFGDPDLKGQDFAVSNAAGAGSAFAALKKFAQDQYAAGVAEPDYPKFLREYFAATQGESSVSAGYMKYLYKGISKGVRNWITGQGSMMDEVAP